MKKDLVWCPADKGMHSCRYEADHDGPHRCICMAGTAPWEGEQ